MTQLPRQEQDKWIEWLSKVQQYVLNLGENSSLAITQHLEQVLKGYQTLGRTHLAGIALQKSTQAAQQIPDLLSRTNQFIQLATISLRFQYKAEAEHALTQALSAVEQFPTLAIASFLPRNTESREFVCHN